MEKGWNKSLALPEMTLVRRSDQVRFPNWTSLQDASLQRAMPIRTRIRKKSSKVPAAAAAHPPPPHDQTGSAEVGSPGTRTVLFR